MSKRYSVKPSDFLKDDLPDHQFNLLVHAVGIQAEIKANKKGR